MASEDYFDPSYADRIESNENTPRAFKHGQPWSVRDDAYLIGCLKRKWPIDAIGNSLGRTVAAIECRIEWLATGEERRKKLKVYIAKLIKEKR